ncbi:MAG: MerR family transcriptional regulator [Pseudomonadota bacterium]
MAKSTQAFRTIREVADWLGVAAHVLRFWESKFPQIKPVKRAGGRRYYRPSDMELVGGIKVLLHDEGMTIRGVQKMLRTDGMDAVVAKSPPLEGSVDGDASDGTGAVIDHETLASMDAEPVEAAPATTAKAPSKKKADAKKTDAQATKEDGEQPSLPWGDPPAAALETPALVVEDEASEPEAEPEAVAAVEASTPDPETTSDDVDGPAPEAEEAMAAPSAAELSLPDTGPALVRLAALARAAAANPPAATPELDQARSNLREVLERMLH